MFVVENNQEELNAKLVVSDLAGKIISTSMLENKQINEVNLQYLENGVYLIEVSSKNNTEYSKIIIAK